MMTDAKMIGKDWLKEAINKRFSRSNMTAMITTATQDDIAVAKARPIWPRVGIIVTDPTILMATDSKEIFSTNVPRDEAKKTG